MRTRPSLDSALRGLLATQSSGATTPPQTCGQERKKLAEHSSGKTAVNAWFMWEDVLNQNRLNVPYQYLHATGGCSHEHHVFSMVKKWKTK